jgi:hypothetical protein
MNVDVVAVYADEVELAAVALDEGRQDFAADPRDAVLHALAIAHGQG